MRIAELPFRSLPTLELFNLHVDRDAPDPDYTGFGWCRATVSLNDLVVEDAVILALHCVEGGGGGDGDVDLEFFLEEDRSVVVSLAKFLEVWLPRLGAAAASRPVVLSMCNPRRERLRLPYPVHHALGDVESWLDPSGRIRLAAPEWVHPTMKLDEETKHLYAGIWLLKKMDLKPEDGGLELKLQLPHELAPLEDVLMPLIGAGHVAINKKKERYEITKAGLAYIGELIDEAEALIDEFEEMEPEEVVRELKARRLDPFRARFLWEWYTGELDDLVIFQQRRGITPVQTLWAYYLIDDDFWNALAQDVAEMSAN